jgi:DNA-binding FrmR family transcriptional regulator
MFIHFSRRVNAIASGTSRTPETQFRPDAVTCCGAFADVTNNRDEFGQFLSRKLCHWSRAGVYRGMLDETQQQSIVTRLNRVEGQIRGIRRMVQEPRLCIELLQQLSAAEAALNRISLAVFRYHVERCVPDGIVQGDPEKTRRLAELVDIFDRFAK